ncbi:MAG: response regulator [Rubripirellula sp.]
MTAILLVDDDMNLLRGLRRVLRDQPYDLYIANSGEMAVQMFQRCAFDLVVVDHKMDRMTGAELITWIADHFPETVRIMLTGNARVELAQEMINRGGVFRFLTKPTGDVDLALAIREGLESARAKRVCVAPLLGSDHFMAEPVMADAMARR